MRIDFVWRAPHDVDAAAIGFPARDARGVVLVGIGDAAVVLFLKGILGRIRVRIAAQPELLDKLFALFVGLQAEEGAAFFGGDDVGYVLVQPLFIGGVQLFVELGFAATALFGGFLDFFSRLRVRLLLITLAGLTGLLIVLLLRWLSFLCAKRCER